MSKRVHFADTNVVYSPHPSPSPALSFTESLPSSSSPDPPTPPPEHEAHQAAVYPTTPYNHPLDVHEETDIPKTLQIHFLLAFHPLADPAIQFDISLPPEMIDKPFPSQVFMEPATSPPMSNLLITHPYFNWDIEVLPASQQPGAFVCVNDVLRTTYRDLDIAISHKDYNVLPHEIKQSIDVAYFTRCARVPDGPLQEKERKQGIKRIDFLMGRTRFMGLSGTLDAPDIWELNVS